MSLFSVSFHKLYTRQTRQTIAAVSLLAAVLSAHANVIISKTRIVYDAADREQTITLTNKDDTPGLIQVWIDDGNRDGALEVLDVPFTLTPPILRLEAHKSQTIRIAHSAENLAHDKETLFWFNILQIPPEAKTDQPNAVSFAYRTRIKMFYRPTILKKEADDAVKKVTWKLAKDHDKPVLMATNPTPYHVSYGTINLVSRKQEIPAFNDNGTPGGMLTPQSTTTFQLKDITPLPSVTSVKYESVNDKGITVMGEYKFE